MGEIKKEVSVYKIDMECDNCKGGIMLPTGECYTTYPLKYQHSCNKCDNKENYFKIYPFIQYED